MFNTKLSKFYALLGLILIIISNFIIITFVFSTKSAENIMVKQWLVVFMPAILIVLASIVLFVLVNNLNNKIILLEDEYSEIIDAKNNEIETYINSRINKEVESQRITVQAKEKEELILSVKNYNCSQIVSVNELYEKLIQHLSHKIEIVQAIAFAKEKPDELYKCVAKYAYLSENEPQSFAIGQGINGQVAKDQKSIILKNISSEIMVVSGLGKAKPRNVAVIPVVLNNECIGIIEFGLFHEINDDLLTIFELVSVKIAEILPKLATKTKVNNEI